MRNTLQNCFYINLFVCHLVNTIQKDLVNPSPTTMYLTKVQAYTTSLMGMDDIAAKIIFTAEVSICQQ